MTDMHFQPDGEWFERTLRAVLGWAPGRELSVLFVLPRVVDVRLLGATRDEVRQAEWILTDERFAGLTITVETTTLASGVGFVVRVAGKGTQPQDQLMWLYGGYLIGWGLDGQTMVGKPVAAAWYHRCRVSPSAVSTK